MRRRYGPRAGALFLVLLVASAMVGLAPAAAAAPRGLYVSSTNGLMYAFSVNADGSLQSRGVPGTGGSLTEGVAVTPDAKYVYVANFLPGNGSVAAFNVGPVDNIIPVTNSPFTAGFVDPLGVVPDPNGRWLFTWNHNANAINVSTIAADGQLSNIGGSPFPLPAGQLNPFAGSVAPDGNHLYVPNENSTDTIPGCGGTCEVDRVSVYSVAADGTLTNIQNPITGSDNVNPSGPNPFGSAITPNGRFLYVSNPEDGPNGSITGFAVNGDGTLTALPGLQSLNVAPGNHPLNMAITPDGQHLYVATRISKTINAYTIGSDGSLTPVPGQPFATGAGDVNGKGIAITPDGKRLYSSAGGTDHKVFGFDINADGSLTALAGGPTDLGAAATPDLEAIVITPNQPPVAAFTSQGATATQVTTFDASGSSDSDGTVASYVWDFGDGSTPVTTSGPTTTHVYASPGTFNVQLTVTDNEGCSTLRIFTGKAMLCNGSAAAETTSALTIGPQPKPILTGLSITPSSFRAASQGGPIGPKPKPGKPKTGGDVSYTDSQPATTTFTVIHKVPGVRNGKRCVALHGPAPKHARRCTARIPIGQFKHTDTRGKNTFHFTGRLGGRKLAAGFYALRAIARNAGGASSARSTPFQILS